MWGARLGVVPAAPCSGTRCWCLSSLPVSPCEQSRLRALGKPPGPMKAKLAHVSRRDSEASPPAEGGVCPSVWVVHPGARVGTALLGSSSDDERNGHPRLGRSLVGRLPTSPQRLRSLGYGAHPM